ncbi:little elongation complex subunit 2 isoform X1 [Felis catus]|uniref:Little elongation complex subunit 2 C-terminal domain-containing protein n=2 Tax=Felis catus TaxID=9685 RepID=A0ABI8A1M6_FELCA|nr:little elongation complex subunit 2 isoform X1 [Felis catus]XP_019687885.3 little elongation complex subunit 2 isoform X1 [Felis catus]XP_019687886.3 little elongation complex subunit 2 isoform X1 [Felis catus]XP_044915158.1 little elongation complex subunit 2 isoform X1 [Felis catus]XP_044915159.1 little elongation complex subunit 2 isoform X1 [Felis catus]XP_044915160.1 little elongation complex subunit 2 isoform X1 [Felis catus]XP_044915161.1 little elongation complex subunit 2 isoform 
MSSMMAMGEPRLNWDVSPKNGLKTFFSQENYKDHSMAPSLKELCVLSNRRIGENLNASASSVENEPAVSSATQAKEKVKTTVGMVLLPKPRVPYPRFSRFSQREQRSYVDLLVKYAKIPANSKAVGINKNDYLQYLDMKKHVNEEVTEFLKFLQNSAKKCAQDYNMLSDDARLFTEKILKACIEQVKKYPEFYTLHEVTSLMGFFPFRIEMGLKLEKTLLALGSVKYVKTVFPSMPAKLQLSKDNISTTETPEKTAAAMHYDISKDPNAEKLVSRYHPQIALTSQSLFTLLNNHGPNYREQWEIPVCIQVIPVAGSKPVKVIYINSPLPQKKMTMRERNQIYHEVPLKFMMSKNTSVPVSAVFMDKPEDYMSEMESIFGNAPWILGREKMSYEVNECRKIETLENLDLDFDGDVTELETFGVNTTKPSKSPSPASTYTVPNTTDTPTAPSTATTSVAPTAPDISAHSRSLSQILMEQLQKEKQLMTGMDGGPEECKNKDDQGYVPCGEKASNPEKSLVQDSDLKMSDSLQLESSTEIETSNKNDIATDTVYAPEKLNILENTDNSKEKTVTSEAVRSEDVILCNSDTDEDCLIIDTECQNNSNGKTADVNSNLNSKPASPNSSSTQASVGNQTNATCSPEESCVLKKPIKRVYKKFDPVGEILKMQDELLKPISRKIPELPLMNLENSKQTPPSEQSSAPSDASSWPKSVWPSAFQKPKGRLPYELQDYVEDTTEYVAPQEGNFVYKLFSLQDLLLLVRCSVQRIETRPRSKKRKKIRRQFPVYVLPKVEYQACYGVEALTESELCRLWTESLLHSNCSFYVGHIDAFTSKLFLLEEITSEELKEKLSALKISSLFNILQHILKKLSSLQEGSYLLSHAAEDSSLLIYKTSDGKVTRTAYNLHKTHCSLPGVPSSLSVPWVPLDPSLLLPYHIHHGRIPCTFPPKSVGPTPQQKVGGTRMPTRSRRNPVSMETKSLPAQQVENEGEAPNKRKIT